MTPYCILGITLIIELVLYIVFLWDQISDLLEDVTACRRRNWMYEREKKYKHPFYKWEDER